MDRFETTAPPIVPALPCPALAVLAVLAVPLGLAQAPVPTPAPGEVPGANEGAPHCPYINGFLCWKFQANLAATHGLLAPGVI